VAGVPAIPLDLPGASTQLINGRVLVLGMAVGELTGAAAAKVRFRDGTTVNGGRILPVTLGANETVRDWFGDFGFLYQQGVFFELVSGSVEGCIYVTPEDLLGPGGFGKLITGLYEGIERVG
jgi:hypothetical protein